MEVVVEDYLTELEELSNVSLLGYVQDPETQAAFFDLTHWSGDETTGVLSIMKKVMDVEDQVHSHDQETDFGIEFGQRPVRARNALTTTRLRRTVLLVCTPATSRLDKSFVHLVVNVLHVL